MKKYVKPELYYENFELSQHIASCYITLTSQNQYTCKGDAGGTYIFTSDASCGNLVENPESYCYTTGNDFFTMFLS